MPSHPKRHHYLPESYLKRFTREKALWVYDIESKQLRPQTPHDTGAIGYFNALEDRDGNRSFVIEEALGEIEGATAQVMLRIDEREKLSDEDRQTLAHFVALQMLRGPDFHQDVNKMNDRFMRLFTEHMFSDRERAEKMWNKAAAKLGGTSGGSFDEAKEFIEKGEYTIKTHRNRTLELMLELAPDFANIFLRLDWMILCGPQNKAFVTCDRPFSIVPPRDRKPSPFRGVGIATKGAWKLMPLSMNRCLVMADPGSVCAYSDCDMNSVRQINLNISHGANRFVIGSDRELVDSLVNEIQQVHAERGMKWGGSRLVIG
jgi:hypothetical protein